MFNMACQPLLHLNFYEGFCVSTNLHTHNQLPKVQAQKNCDITEMFFSIPAAQAKHISSLQSSVLAASVPNK